MSHYCGRQLFFPSLLPHLLIFVLRLECLLFEVPVCFLFLTILSLGFVLFFCYSLTFRQVYGFKIDFINPYLFSAPAFYRKETLKPPYIATAQIVLLTNNNNIATMKYVFNQVDLTQWSSKALEALATKLAYQLCFKISEAAQYAVGLEKEYLSKLISAITSDSNTTSPDQAIADAWFNARLSGSTGAIGLGPDGNNVGWFIPGVEG